MQRLLPLLLLAAACARPLAPAPAEADRPELTLEVTNESVRTLDVPRPDILDQIGRLRSGSAAPAFSTTDAFAEAATEALAKRGIRARPDRRDDVAVLRIAVADLEIRDAETAAAVAFVSARYALLDGRGVPRWQTAQKRLAVNLGGPDLTRPVLFRIATVAIERALSSLPATIEP